VCWNLDWIGCYSCRYNRLVIWSMEMGEQQRLHVHRNPLMIWECLPAVPSAGFGWLGLAAQCPVQCMKEEGGGRTRAGAVPRLDDREREMESAPHRTRLVPQARPRLPAPPPRRAPALRPRGRRPGIPSRTGSSPPSRPFSGSS
jgi:hypothetical protein